MYMYLGKYINILTDFASCSHRMVNSKKYIQPVCIHSNVEFLSYMKTEINFGNYFTHFTFTIAHETEIFRGCFCAVHQRVILEPGTSKQTREKKPDFR